jgi:hypothetical protein
LHAESAKVCVSFWLSAWNSAESRIFPKLHVETLISTEESQIRSPLLSDAKEMRQREKRTPI